MLLKHTLAYLPAQLLGPAAQFVTALVLTHALGAADYGLTLLVFALQELVFLLCLSWWTTFFLRYGSGRAGAINSADGDLASTSPPTPTPPTPPTPPTLAGTESAVLLVSAVAQALVTVLVLLVAEPQLGSGLLAGACAYTVSRSLLSFLAERARRDAAIGAYSLLQIAAPLGGLVLTLGLMALQRASPLAVLLAFAVVQLLVGAAVAWRLGLWVRPSQLDRPVLRAAARFGAPVVLANLLSWLGGNSIRFVVQHGAGAAALGLLSVAWGLATRLTGVAAMLVTAAAYPLAVRAMQAGDVAGAKRQISANAVLVLLVLAPTLAAAVALTELFVHSLVAAEYQTLTIQLLPWALLGAAVRNLRLHGWDQLYLLCEAPRAMLVMDFLEALVTTLAAVLGLWLGGLLGAVVGTTLAALLMAVGDWWVLRRHFGLQVHWAASARVLLAAATMYGGLLAGLQAGWWAVPGAPSLLAASACALLLYALALALVFADHTRRFWRQGLTRWRLRG